MRKFKELAVRRVPQAALEAARSETFVAHERDQGRVEAQSMLSVSVFAEYFEMLLLAMRREQSPTSVDGEEKAFLNQEARHAAACHVLNERILGTGAYRHDPRLGRIPAIVDSHPLLGADASFEELSFTAAATEAAFGVQSVLAMDNAGEARWLKHPGAYYLFLYHMAEEAEHSHVSWAAHERAFGPIDVKSRRFLGVLERYGAVAARLMCRLGDHLGAPIVVDDAVASWSRIIELGKNRATSGDFEMFTDARRQCVQRWDGQWEPVYRRACEQLAP